MNNKEIREVVILGRGHLAAKLKRKLEKNSFKVRYIETQALKNSELEFSSFENSKKILLNNNLSNASFICILDDEDDKNIELVLLVTSICNNVPIYLSLFNPGLGAHIKKLHDNIHIINPASISAPFFWKKYEQELRSSENKEKFPRIRLSYDRSGYNDDLILLLSFFFFVLYAGGAAFFKYNERLSWIDSLYFTTVTIATVGYGDISLKSASGMTKAFSIFFMLSSMIIVWTFFSLLIEKLVRKRNEEELGRKKYNFSGHIIICGLGRIGFGLVEELAKKNKKIIIIEDKIENRFLELAKSKGIKIFLGDATLTKNLLDAGIQKAQGAFIMIDNDMKNLEIGLNMLRLNPNLQIVLRIYDESLAEKIRTQLKMPLAFSTTSFAAERLFNMISKN